MVHTFDYMKILTKRISLKDLNKMAGSFFGNLVKAVVDIDREVIAVDAELHSDLESFLLQDGSKQKNLWGINLYPEIESDEFIEFDSMINLRPSQGNKSRGVDNAQIREKIACIVNQRIER